MNTDLLALLCALLMACTAAASTFSSLPRSTPGPQLKGTVLPDINWGSSA